MCDFLQRENLAAFYLLMFVLSRDGRCMLDVGNGFLLDRVGGSCCDEDGAGRRDAGRRGRRVEDNALGEVVGGPFHNGGGDNASGGQRGPSRSKSTGSTVSAGSGVVRSTSSTESREAHARGVLGLSVSDAQSQNVGGVLSSNSSSSFEGGPPKRLNRQQTDLLTGATAPQHDSSPLPKGSSKPFSSFQPATIHNVLLLDGRPTSRPALLADVFKRSLQPIKAPSKSSSSSSSWFSRPLDLASRIRRHSSGFTVRTIENRMKLRAAAESGDPCWWFDIVESEKIFDYRNNLDRMMEDRLDASTDGVLLKELQEDEEVRGAERAGYVDEDAGAWGAGEDFLEEDALEGGWMGERRERGVGGEERGASSWWRKFFHTRRESGAKELHTGRESISASKKTSSSTLEGKLRRRRFEEAEEEFLEKNNITRFSGSVRSYASSRKSTSFGRSLSRNRSTSGYAVTK